MTILFELVALLFLLLGLILDALTVIWAYESTRGKTYKSGNFLVPLGFYVIFIFMTNITNVEENKLLFFILFLSVHLCVYLFSYYFFDRIFKA